MNPRCCQAVGKRGSVSITAGSACSENTVASRVIISSALCSRPSHSSEANTTISSAAPTSVGSGSTEIRPSPPMRSRSASPSRSAGTQYSSSAATSRQPSTTPGRVGTSRSRRNNGLAGGGTSASGAFSGPVSVSLAGRSGVSSRTADSDGVSASGSAAGLSEDSEPGSRSSTGRPTISGRLTPSAQVGRWSPDTIGVPVGGVPGPGRTSGRRSRWSKSTWMPSARVSESSAQAGPRRRGAAAGTSRAPRSARSPSGAASSGNSAAGAARRVRNSFGAAIVTITARLEISATPAPVRPMRGSSSSVRLSTRTHNRPCSQASPLVRLCARSTAKYVSMTTRSSAPTANQRSSGVAASA